MHLSMTRPMLCRLAAIGTFQITPSTARPHGAGPTDHRRRARRSAGRMSIAGSHVWAKIIPTSLLVRGQASWQLNYACAAVELVAELLRKSVLAPVLASIRSLHMKVPSTLGVLILYEIIVPRDEYFLRRNRSGAWNACTVSYILAIL
jgi:hypothetical protein